MEPLWTGPAGDTGRSDEATGSNGLVTLAPGAVLLGGALDLGEQVELVASCRKWARPPAGLRSASMPNGKKMSARQVSLGWHWYPYRYSRTVDDGGGEPVKAFPDSLYSLGRRLVAAADPVGRWFDADAYEPDLALVNFYDDQARMGLHQDRDEHSRAPVVSISLGDDGVFRFGNTENRNRPWRDVTLHSGDVVVFGGPARLAYHGVQHINPGTGPAIGMTGGRLNITIRESGFD